MKVHSFLFSTSKLLFPLYCLIILTSCSNNLAYTSQNAEKEQLGSKVIRSLKNQKSTSQLLVLSDLAATLNINFKDGQKEAILEMFNDGTLVDIFNKDYRKLSLLINDTPNKKAINYKRYTPFFQTT
ncbi:hypothetical protein KUL17_05550 [Alteromonas sp. KUL17]|uniref:hypothetical protein n=1 Tax=Alteromonas sp. KUL17 TaxID=2480796 RepID=UPI001037D7C3|nr:hypothetical protein [Alteromonas sp. KUL17]TAP30662.1 hypothetical protein KUL49_02755 [Alteromonas sp. KUL17]GEA01658.1 hypothetical protein KUL17_05550 [Alteromonas sp. KUL17]